jgi:hypothetical protein
LLPTKINRSVALCWHHKSVWVLASSMVS